MARRLLLLRARSTERLPALRTRLVAIALAEATTSTLLRPLALAEAVAATLRAVALTKAAAATLRPVALTEAAASTLRPGTLAVRLAAAMPLRGPRPLRPRCIIAPLPASGATLAEAGAGRPCALRPRA